MTDIFENAYKALEIAKKEGADEVEIYCMKGRSRKVLFQGSASGRSLILPAVSLTAHPGELERLNDTANCHRILLKSSCVTTKENFKLSLI